MCVNKHHLLDGFGNEIVDCQRTKIYRIWLNPSWRLTVWLYICDT